MIAGLVLAAGAGTRFGPAPKLLAELDGRPLLEHAIRAQCEVPELERVVVVFGAGADEVVAGVDLHRAEAVVCPDWSAGISASLRCGADALADADRVIVTLGDQPAISAVVIRRFLDAAPGTRATYHGHPGHPVVLGGASLDAVRALNGDEGARRLIDGGATIECSDLCSGTDVDTPEDLEVIRNAARAVI